MNGLTPKQSRFVKNLTSLRLNKQESTLKAGYSPNSASVIASQLLRKTSIIKALEQSGITDKFIAKNLKKHITDGVGIKPSADTSLRALDLATRLKGYQQNDKEATNLSQTNIYINQLRQLSSEELKSKLNILLQDIEILKAK
jgi:CRISPR/Cas system Type II protein with McrA/HNH and RuvC-like nuclease domain